MSNDHEHSDNNEKLDAELKKYEELRNSMVSEEDENYWYNPEVIKDISEGVRKKLIGVVIICCMFIVAEAIGAYLSDSVAIFTDVAHLFSDLIGFIISLISVNLAKRRASLKHSYGYVRAESVGALFSVVIIWGLTIWIFFKSVHKLVYKEYETLKPYYMLGSALLGLTVNIIMAVFLHSHGHSHDHGHEHEHSHGQKHDHAHKPKPKHVHKHDEHDHEHEKESHHIRKKEDKATDLLIHVHSEHDEEHAHEHADDHNHDDETKPLKKPHTQTKNSKRKNLSLVSAHQSHNIQAAWIHILGDLVQSIGVVIFSIIIFFRNDWKFLDPVISIIFVIIAASFSVPVAKSIITIMLDATPADMDIERFILTLKSIKHVTEIHDLHVWNLTHGKPSMTAHIIVDDRVDHVLKKATIECRKVGIYHSTIQVEKMEDSHKINCEHNLHM